MYLNRAEIESDFFLSFFNKYIVKSYRCKQAGTVSFAFNEYTWIDLFL